MSALRICLCLLICAVLVQAYSDYYRPVSKKKYKSPAKYAATLLAPPKLNRFYRPRHHHGPAYGERKARGGSSLGINDGVVSGLLGGKVPFKGKIIAQIPVKSSHQLKFRHYPVKSGYSTYEHELPQIVEVTAKSIPLSLVFRTSSSKINIQQLHDSTHAKQYGGPKVSHSYDEPHILKHTVTKPIYQMIHEVIVPYRKLTQTVNPVTETVQTNVATSAKAPAMQNAYQLEPVLYMTPDAINSQAEYKTEPVVSSAKVEGYQGEAQPLMVSQYGQYGPYEQQLSQQLGLLDQQPHVTAYEALQPVQQVAVEAPVASVQPVNHSDGPQQSLSHSEPLYSEQVPPPPPPPPVTLVADASLLDTYMRYAQLSTQDLLLPVYQQTHLPSVQYLPSNEHGAPQVETVQVTETHGSAPALQAHQDQQQQYTAALPLAEIKKA